MVTPGAGGAGRRRPLKRNKGLSDEKAKMMVDDLRPRARTVSSTERRIEVKMGKTIEIGKFEFVRIDASLSVRLPDGVDLNEAYDEAWGVVTEQLDKKETSACESASRNVRDGLRREAMRGRRRR
jgi:hypothetical protein